MHCTGLPTYCAMRIVFALLLISVSSLAVAGDAEDEIDRATKLVAAQNGVVSGSLNPGKRGIIIPANARVLVIPMYDANSRYGMIDDWMAGFIERRLTYAAKEKYNLVILEMDTNGGSVDSCERINKAIAKCPVPVVTYITGKAFSGGALVSLGTKMIVMNPSTQIGGAKVVTLFGDIPKDMRPKIDAEIRAQVLGTSGLNNHPSAIAVGMVNEGAEVWETNSPTQRFMLLEDLEAAERTSAPPARIKQWKQKGTILSLTDVEARNSGLSSGTVSNADELYIGLGTKPVALYRAEITTSESIARFLSHPLWRVLLVVLGLILLILELKSPGHGLGFIGFGFCMGLFFWLQIFASTAGLAEILLFGLGALLVAIELFLLPGFGFIGFIGFGCLLVSIILSFLPEGALSKIFDGTASPGDKVAISGGLNYALLTVVLVVGGAIFALWKGAALPGLSRLALKTESGGTTTVSVDGSAAVAGTIDGAAFGGAPVAATASKLSTLVGVSGIAETMLRPGGKVRITDRTYDALSETSFIEAGKKVIVVRATVTELVVREQA